jgi:hypothetical protein
MIESLNIMIVFKFFTQRFTQSFSKNEVLREKVVSGECKHVTVSFIRDIFILVDSHER